MVIHFFWYTATGEIFKGNGYLRSVYQKKYVKFGIWITFGGSVIPALVLWITGGNPPVDVYGHLRSCEVSIRRCIGLPNLVLRVIALLAVQEDQKSYDTVRTSSRTLAPIVLQCKLTKSSMVPYVRKTVCTAPIVLQCKDDQKSYDDIHTVYRT